ncbi:MAG: molybdopterin oxidoreductase family protein [Nitrospinae bacterium]|nr:molybdopterin oxidoreductase family protein [Nitrospinota bacterium]
MPTAAQTKDNGGTETKFTTCYMCSCRCGIKITIENGMPRYIQGNPAHPTNKGVICAKGSAGIMKQMSPARIKKPLLRKPNAERGAADFEEISWERAYDMLTGRLKHIRATDPKKLAFFTGRDQMQALTAYFAKQFGTPNFAAHGGFCSVNMATSMIYSIGGTGWEFGGPDWDRTKYTVLIGVAEDHDSNPFKIGIGKLKDRGGKLVVINPVRSGYGAVADEWVPIRPGTDGALLMGMIHVLIKNGLYDRDFLVTQTNAAQLVVVDEGGEDEGLFWTPGKFEDSDHSQNHVWDTASDSPQPFMSKGAKPALMGSYKTPDGKNVKTSFQLLTERVLTDYPLENISRITSVPVEQIERIALEMGITARDEKITLPIEWTDVWGNHHHKVTGNPVSIHAMRGVAAHSNGFQTGRALSTLMMILGTIDRPGGFRHKPPYPRPIPPCPKPIDGPEHIKPNTPLPNPELGFPTKPENLMINADGSPVRIDKAFSWEFPLTAHGMIQNVITNAHNADPYKIDTLFFFMANMAWNSSMNTSAMINMLKAKEPDGTHKIPFLVVSDAFYSEMVAFADLVLPDTTYLERYDVISLLDRPISEFTSVVDSIRQPIFEAPEGCEPFQETLIKLANRLGLQGFCDDAGKPKFKGYNDFVTNWTVAADTPIGFLAGWRGKDGSDHLVGEPNEKQWDMYIKNGCFFQFELEESIQYNRNINQGYLNWALDHKLIRRNDPIIMKIYSEVMQRFRLAAKGTRPGRQPATRKQRDRLLKYFDPLPMWYPPLEDGTVDTNKYTIHAITQRPMPMYHSWDSQNAWLRQIIGQNYLYINPVKARQIGVNDMDWVWVESAHGKIRVQAKFSHAVQPDTVWTWNGIGKMAGAWNLDPKAEEVTKGFLLNHCITEEIADGHGGRVSNSDPITGQAAWYDLRVRIYKAEEEGSWPQYEPLKPLPHMARRPDILRYTTRKGGK